MILLQLVDKDDQAGGPSLALLAVPASYMLLTAWEACLQVMSFMSPMLRDVFYFHSMLCHTNRLLSSNYVSTCKILCSRYHKSAKL